MATIQLRNQQHERFTQFLQKMQALEGVRLADALPKDVYKLRVWRGMLGFVASYALYIGSLVGICYAPHWVFYLPLWLTAGLGGWGLFCIAHDCGHNSFSKSRSFNYFLGNVSLLPVLFPFHGWRHSHNLHHANTNKLETDPDFRPASPEEYSQMHWLVKIVYTSVRTWAFWLATAGVYQPLAGFRPSAFSKPEHRRDARRSILVIAMFAALYFPALIHFTGWSGFVLYFFGPWLGIHAWFSTTTMMHHAREDIPFLTKERWLLNASRILMTIDYRYSKVLHFFTHNISLHTAHHVAPVLRLHLLQLPYLLLSAPGFHFLGYRW